MEESRANRVIISQSASSSKENELKCIIKNVAQFKTCLESVKFPINAKNKYNVSSYLAGAQLSL